MPGCRCSGLWGGWSEGVTHMGGWQMCARQSGEVARGSRQSTERRSAASRGRPCPPPDAAGLAGGPPLSRAGGTVRRKPQLNSSRLARRSRAPVTTSPFSGFSHPLPATRIFFLTPPSGWGLVFKTGAIGVDGEVQG